MSSTRWHPKLPVMDVDDTQNLYSVTSRYVISPSWLHRWLTGGQDQTTDRASIFLMMDINSLLLTPAPPPLICSSLPVIHPLNKHLGETIALCTTFKVTASGLESTRRTPVAVLAEPTLYSCPFSPFLSLRWDSARALTPPCRLIHLCLEHE